MPITAKYFPNILGDLGGVYRPFVICDFCGKAIRKHGNVTWLAEEPQRVYFTHKQCQRVFERSRPGLWLAEDLAVFIRYLVKNSELDLNRKGHTETLLEVAR